MRPLLPLAALAVLTSLAGCDLPADRNTSYNYRPGFEEQTLPLHYARDAVDPTPDDSDALADLRVLLRPNSALVLRVREVGPLATVRAERVAGALGRTVELQASDEPRRNETLLSIRTPTIVADACMQPPTRVGRNLWTFDDYSRERLLPPGCANAVMLLRQAEAGQDTLRGRRLEPGAAGPMARAADRYLSRNDNREQPRRQGRDGNGTTDEGGETAGGSPGLSGGGGAAGGVSDPGPTAQGALPGLAGATAAPGTASSGGGLLLAPRVPGGAAAP